MPGARLPEGRHLVLAWTIPDSYGGLTRAMLHRSSAFARLAGVPVDILTLDNRPDYPAVEQRLRDRGDLTEGVRLCNLWDWLRENEVPPAANPLGSTERVFTPLGPAASSPAERDGVVLSRTRYADDGATVLQVDHYRTDGTLLASDRRDTVERGVLGGRSIVVCDAEGRPARSWGRSWSLYTWWLDRLTEGSTAFIVADSKPAARFLRTYRRPDRVTVHVVHGSHLSGRIGPWGRLRPSREDVFRHLDDFDGVVFLTRRQKRDAELLLGRKRNLSVIPNSRELPDLPPGFHIRPPHSGVAVAALTRLKRMEHAVEAVGQARRSRTAVRLDVFGDGPERNRIERLIQVLGLTEAVRLHGHRPDARDRLTEASFLLMTSSSEGFSLVILEAMAAGCIPIAYDVRYGPRELISHGRTGFLVRSGSVRGLARAILRLQRLPPHRVAAMRTAARRAAERFSDEAVLPLWARTLHAARKRNAESAWDTSAAR